MDHDGSKRAQKEQAARSILAIQFSEEARLRMDFLADKARQGTLTVDEQHEIAIYEQSGHRIAILQSEARKFLSAGDNETA